MGRYAQLIYHLVFGTKYRQPLIQDDMQSRLYSYIKGLLRNRESRLIEIGGMSDHLHILAHLSPTRAVADMMRDLKALSSKWMNLQPENSSSFEWQRGYGAFTVSYSRVPRLREYIRNQEEHHRVKSFQEEYIEILKRHGVEFQTQRLFEDEHLA